jgi:hypothetical protein
MARALKQLEHLPVWTVIRLCTDEDEVGDYWSGIDDNIELQMDVLDDLAGEAREVKMCNPCVTYCEQLHRLRENGARIKVFDFLDEKRLFPAELRTLMSVVIGGKEEDYTHPDVDIDSFVEDCSAAIQRTKMVYDPFRKQLKYIIDPKVAKPPKLYPINPPSKTDHSTALPL